MLSGIQSVVVMQEKLDSGSTHCRNDVVQVTLLLPGIYDWFILQMAQMIEDIANETALSFLYDWVIKKNDAENEMNFPKEE